ncbi:hypothetical protein K0M31_007987 [Melipona bicolor]|uniref:Uncharacterized protein n=1 Tax=Melipona bicolor TaxID=60889 RepID=A0AA40GDT6_9HYME|nr:hypothetical protein K0M31_007987 [Melipona bicolor]
MKQYRILFVCSSLTSRLILQEINPPSPPTRTDGKLEVKKLREQFEGIGRWVTEVLEGSKKKKKKERKKKTGGVWGCSAVISPFPGKSFKFSAGSWPNALSVLSRPVFGL